MKHLEYVCKSYEMTRDLSRYVVLSVNVYNFKTKQVFSWTHCEWFKYQMPSEYLFSWIKDVEPELRDVSFSLYCKLNDNSRRKIDRNNSPILKDICASHIMEIECVNDNR